MASLGVQESLKGAAKMCTTQNRFNVIIVHVDDFDVEDIEWNHFMQQNQGRTPLIACGETLTEATFDRYKEKGFSFWLNYPLEAERLIAAVRIFIN